MAKSNLKSIEQTVQEREQEATQAFAKAYEELTQKHGYAIATNPAWVKRDDGSYSMVVQMSVAKLPKNGDTN